MRYHPAYFDWAERAEHRHLPGDRERASLTAAKIRDNLSSDFDSQQIKRMERIARGNTDRGWDDDSGRAKPVREPVKPQRAKPSEWRELSFGLEGSMVRIRVHGTDLNADRLPSLISLELASRPALDLTIYGVEVRRITAKSCRLRLDVADYDYEDECDVGRRTIDVTAGFA